MLGGSNSAMNMPGRLRVAFVVDVCDDSKSGGVRSARRLIEALARRCDVHVVTTGLPQPGRVVVPGFYVPLAGRLMRSMDFMFAWPRDKLLAELFRRSDVVHVQLPFFLGFRSVRIAGQLGVPVVGGYHVQPENLLYNVGLRSERLAERLNHFLVSRFYNRCTAVVCPSAFAAAELKRYGLRSPSSIISNGVPDQFKPTADRRKPGAQADFVVLMVGRLGREKRQDLLIQAASRSKHGARLSLILIGKGPMQAQLIQMGRALPRPPVVRTVSDAELIHLYNNADLFVHASEIELEGMSVLEAMGCGLPVLIADAKASAAKQFALDARFLFSSNDPDALAARMDYWIEHPAELEAAGQRCLKFARQYTLTGSAEQLIHVYHACVSRQHTLARETNPGIAKAGRHDNLITTQME